MRCLKWYVVLVACLWTNSLHAQLLQVDSTKCELYLRQAIPCRPPQEFHRVAPESFTVFGDSTCDGFWGCDPERQVGACVQQITKLLPDSLFIHASAYSLLNGPQAEARSRSDASITFRVDSGHRVRYYLVFSEFTYAEGLYGCRAVASFSLISAGRVIRSFHLQSGLGFPVAVDRRAEDGYDGFLDAGVYVLEGHAIIEEVVPYGLSSSELYLRLGLHEATTAIAPASWGLVKSLYR